MMMTMMMTMSTTLGVTCAGVRAKTTVLIRVTGAHSVVAAAAAAAAAGLLDADVTR